MQKAKILIEVPISIKAKLDALRATGTSASGLIRHLLNQHFGLRAAKERRQSK